MILSNFPDYQWLKEKAENAFSDRHGWNGITLEKAGWPDVIINTTTKNCSRRDIKGPFSIFSTSSGRSKVTVDNRAVHIEPDHFFISNQTQYYSLEVEEDQTELMNFHISESTLQDFFSVVNTSSDIQLDNGTTHIRLPYFNNQLLHRTDSFDQILALIQANGNEAGKLQQDRMLFKLLDEFYHIYYGERLKAEQISAAKNVIREEIYKRVTLATDYIIGHYAQDISLQELSQIACMSRFHFLRAFKEIHNITPHQYLLQYRLKKAISMLSKQTVSEIALNTGFNDASSLSRAFKNVYGYYPTQYQI